MLRSKVCREMKKTRKHQSSTGHGNDRHYILQSLPQASPATPGCSPHLNLTSPHLTPVQPQLLLRKHIHAYFKTIRARACTLYDYKTRDATRPYGNDLISGVVVWTTLWAKQERWLWHASGIIQYLATPSNVTRPIRPALQPSIQCQVDIH